MADKDGERLEKKERRMKAESQKVEDAFFRFPFHPTVMIRLVICPSLSATCRP